MVNSANFSSIFIIACLNRNLKKRLADTKAIPITPGELATYTINIDKRTKHIIFSIKQAYLVGYISRI